MQLVVEISDECYIKLLKNCHLSSEEIPIISRAIATGIPLSTGHGKLIDANYLLSILQCEEYETCTWRNCSECNREKCIKRHMILDAPPIIEADKEQKDGKVG